MSGQFFCKKPGGYEVKDAGGAVQVYLMEGTKEKGPWYQIWAYSDEQIERWLAKGIIEVVD